MTTRTCLPAALGLILSSACSSPSPTSPTNAVSSTVRTTAPAAVTYTAPVSGAVVDVNGRSLVGATVYLADVSVAKSISSAVTDASGRYAFPSLPTTGKPYVYASQADMVHGTLLTVPSGATAPAPVDLQLRLQPHLELHEGGTLDITLTNDALDYGSDANIPLGLPGARGPIVVIDPSASQGAVLRAEWDTAAPVQIWVEKYYLETYVFSPPPVNGARSAELRLDRWWFDDPMNTATLTIGLPFSSRATGGLAQPTHVHITLTAVAP